MNATINFEKYAKIRVILYVLVFMLYSNDFRAQVFQDFESGDRNIDIANCWGFGGFSIKSNNKINGNYSARSGSINNTNGSFWLKSSWIELASGNITFNIKLNNDNHNQDYYVDIAFIPYDSNSGNGEGTVFSTIYTHTLNQPHSQAETVSYPVPTAIADNGIAYRVYVSVYSQTSNQNRRAIIDDWTIPGTDVSDKNNGCIPFNSGNGGTGNNNLIDTDQDGILDDVDLDDDNDGILDSDECMPTDFMINGDFENGPSLPNNNSYMITNQSQVEGWSTTSNDSKIEIWDDGFNGVPSQSGNYFAEINANNSAALYQELIIPPGTEVKWTAYHRGRSGVDVAEVRIGSDLTNTTVQEVITTGNTAWEKYNGTYLVPQGQVSTFFLFKSVSTAGSNSVGNFLDNVTIESISFQGQLICDQDGDGITNQLDLDSDNDGVLDIVEAGGTDSNFDGVADDFTDTNSDGYVDIFDNVNGGSALPNPDTDADGIKNQLDLDSDNDCIPDNIESQPTATYVSPSVTDSLQDFQNNRGIYSSYVLNPITPEDSEGDGLPDYVDTDSDEDGIKDNDENFSTLIVVSSVGQNGLEDNAETNDDYSDVNGLAHHGSGFGALADTDGDVANGADFDYRDIPNNTSLTDPLTLTRITTSLASGFVTPNKTDAYMNIVANNWGVVITRINGVQTIINPVEGMIIFDTSDSKFKVCIDDSTPTWRELNFSN